jgi:UDP-glucuronate 4-epimerase
MSILITGGAGFIGSNLTEKLLNAGHEVICLDNFNDYYDPQIKWGNIESYKKNHKYTLYEDNIRNLKALNTIFENHKITTIFHLAARAGVRPSLSDPILYSQVNIEGTLNLLEMAKKHSIKKFIFASSSSVYGNNKKTPFSEDDNVDFPVSPYAATKKAGELLCYNYHHLYNIPIACVRFFTVYGPRQRPEMAIHKFTSLISKNQELPVFNNGKCQRDFTYIDDIISGLINIFNKSDLTYDILNLGESKTISTINLIKLIENELGIKAKLKLMPAQPGDVEKTFADISKAKAKYGYNPQYPIEKGIKEFVLWYKNKLS